MNNLLYFLQDSAFTGTGQITTPLWIAAVLLIVLDLRAIHEAGK